MEIYEYIYKLVQYGISKNIITNEDRKCVINKLLDILNLDDQDEITITLDILYDPSYILNKIVDFAIDSNIIKGSEDELDNFKTRLLDALKPCDRRN